MATKQRLVNSKAERDSEAVQDAHKADDAMRQHWNDAVCKEFGVPSHYQSVAVLLIHWAKHLDTQLRCGEETAKLESIFRLKYGYTTRTVVMDCQKKKPEAQLHHEMSNFIMDHDGHHRTNLLIVYYSGHGILQEEDGVNQLYISGTKNANTKEHSEPSLHEPICHWQSADVHLKHAQADVLTIIDSCYASASINKDARFQARSFETLAAAHKYTRSPGESSFTHALMKALNDLHKETVGMERPRPFDTHRLHHRIREDMRPKYHIPPLFDRIETLNARHICLAPLVKTEPSLVLQPQQNKAVLHLQLNFSKSRELSKEEVARLGTSLAFAAKKEELNITTLDYVRFECSAPRVRITVSVAMVLQACIRAWRRRKSFAGSRKRDRASDHGVEPLGKERTSKRPRVDSPML